MIDRFSVGFAGRAAKLECSPRSSSELSLTQSFKVPTLCGVDSREPSDFISDGGGGRGRQLVHSPSPPLGGRGGFSLCFRNRLVSAASSS